MRAQPFDENDLPPIVDRGHQAIVVAFDIKHDPVIANDAGRAIAPLQISGTGPLGSLRFMKPCIECGLDRALPSLTFDKPEQATPRDHPHPGEYSGVPTPGTSALPRPRSYDELAKQGSEAGGFT